MQAWEELEFAKQEGLAEGSLSGIVSGIRYLKAAMGIFPTAAFSIPYDFPRSHYSSP